MRAWSRAPAKATTWGAPVLLREPSRAWRNVGALSPFLRPAAHDAERSFAAVGGLFIRLRNPRNLGCAKQSAWLGTTANLSKRTLPSPWAAAPEATPGDGMSTIARQASSQRSAALLHRPTHAPCASCLRGARTPRPRCTWRSHPSRRGRDTRSLEGHRCIPKG